ncbi:MAG: prolipoprotein diacylglyceryl transferase [Atribacterota bacterium]|nr:prolipoprotein diacylglyceryl transferase [Atribacterota bacterium]
MLGIEWAHIPETINPVLLSLGQFKIYWYGLMYPVAFLTAFSIAIYRIRSEKLIFKESTVLDFLIWAIIMLILGARIGHVISSDIGYYLANPWRIILPFEFSGGLSYTGILGMSYHGGMIGIVLAFIIFCYKRGINHWQFADMGVPGIPAGYTFGRIGNFINGELYGRVTDLPWGMYFPNDPTNQLRHPTQLYEAFFEGIVLFIILWYLRKKKWFNGLTLSIYFIGYGIVRFLNEFLREPSPVTETTYLGFMNLAQIMSLLMILGGFLLIMFRKDKPYFPIGKEDINE